MDNVVYLMRDCAICKCAARLSSIDWRAGRWECQDCQREQAERDYQREPETGDLER